MVWAPDYATLAEAKSYLRIPADDTDDDGDIGTHLTAASRGIDRFANRQFGNAAAETTRYATAHWDRRRGLWIVPIVDLHSVTGLEIAFDSADDQTFTTDLTAYVLEPLDAAADGRPWEQVRLPRSARSINDTEGAFRITSPHFGWSAVPKSVKEACLLQTSRFYKRRDAPFGVAGSAEMGSEIRLLNKLDADVEVALGPFRRTWGAV